MSSRRRWYRAHVAILVALTATLASTAIASADEGTVDLASEAPQEYSARIPNEYLEKTMSLYGRNTLSQSTVRTAFRAARDVGVEAFVVRAPMLAMVQYKRVRSTPDEAPRVDTKVVRRGWRVPMQAVAMPTGLVRRIAGGTVSSVLDAGAVAMGETSAGIRNSKIGDIVTVLDHRGRKKSFVIGVIVPDVFTAEGDLLISDVAALELGVKAIRRVTFVGFSDESQVRRGLAKRGIHVGALHRLSHSWGQQNPDSALGLAKVKELFGEFEYKKVNKKGVFVDSGWRSRSIAHRVTYSDIQLNHNCHVRVIDAIQQALTEIREQGLEDEIDLTNSNRYGGCYVGRFSRLAKDNFGPISRHAWGMAFDINTSTNAQGAVPQMNCDVVRIFRKHGFAWGGNYLMPDGMHFEYVGEPRHNIDYPSTYCPNKP
jgi:hypothetical protein